MRKHILHPVTRLSSPYAELHLIYGGNEYDAIEESMKIACDLRDVVKEGENILYVNTLVSELRMAYAMGKRFDHGARRGRNYFVTYSAGEIIDKLPVLRYMCESKHYKYLVINGFELAMHDARHRAQFMHWLRQLRNEGVNVILFTSSEPRSYGTMGSLRYSARTVAEVGAYLATANEEQYENFEETNPAEDAVAETAAEVTKEANDRSENEEAAELIAEATEFADAPDATKIYAETPIATVPNTQRPEYPQTHPNQHSDSESLKTKELALEYA
jgi:hypothetical protein